MFVRKIALGLVFIMVCLGVSAHSGRTDAYGGHNDRKHGGYHYHNAGRIHAADNPSQNHDTCGVCNEVVEGKIIQELQKLMKKNGTYSGAITGTNDDVTRESIKVN